MKLRELISANKLREELMTVSTDNPTMEELNALPYLENVVRETLRVHTQLVSVRRQALVDDVLPLSIPYMDSKGVVHDSFKIRKGQDIYLPLLAVNTTRLSEGKMLRSSTALFHHLLLIRILRNYRPERWDHLPESVKAIPSVWSNLFTFLAGPHNCIGFPFSIAE
ncbi:hypothetical protein C8J57DRAFT_1258035 [Mycena rebaudengoi]|nr:hypothetical protein C8J57DRAFT_1258035 [Mycena rebaudengoi]